MRKFLKPSVAFLVFFAFFSALSLAQEINPDAAAQRKEKLQQELNAIEAQIDGYRAVIQEKQTQSASLERDIAIFDAKIQKAKLEIKRLDIEIAKLNSGIERKGGEIKNLSEKSEMEKISLAELVRKSNELDAVGLGEIILGYEKMSDFFGVSDSVETVNASIQESLTEIKRTKNKLEKEKDALTDKKAEQARLKTAQEMERKRLSESEQEKKNLLKLTKGVEKGYQAIMAVRQKDAAKIRSQLFLLSGSPAISFEKAVEYANMVWSALKIRPAFLLGVIREESNLGANVGKGNWKEDLAHAKCAKQREAFVQITSELGLDPDAMPVSKKQWYGYCGGAMGPAQFMPTTWLLYKNAIAKTTGHNPPNPWDPQDAFVASGLLLRDNGAAAGGYEAERRAALRYLAGGNWNKPAYSFYGDDVMDFAAEYQEQIDIISKNGG